MPSKSPAQARMMAAAAHNPQFAKKVGVPQGVAQDFNEADTGGKMLAAPKPTPKKSPKGSHGGPKSQFGLPKSRKK